MCRLTVKEVKSSKQKIYGVISDLDGTLYKSDPLQAEFERAYYLFLGNKLGLSTDAVHALVNSTRLELENRLGIIPSELKVLRSLDVEPSEWFRYSETIVKPENYLRTDREMLNALRRIKRVAWLDVTTNTSNQLARSILGCLGITEEIDGLWTADMLANGKPSRELYAYIASSRELPANRFLVIGDRWHIDIVGAQNLGMNARLVDGPEDARREMLNFALAED